MQMDAEKGYARAQSHLGNMYTQGRVVPQDLDKAFHWYLLAANQGLATAQYCVGRAYYGGRGVDKDIDKAFIWFKKSADLGINEAQCKIGKHVNVFMHPFDVC